LRLGIAPIKQQISSGLRITGRFLMGDNYTSL
jgi:hypothetical protein